LMGGMLRQAAARCNRSGDGRDRRRADGRCQQCRRAVRLPKKLIVLPAGERQPAISKSKQRTQATDSRIRVSPAL
jgi:hypothetical protein